MSNINPANKSNVIPMPGVRHEATLSGLPEDFFIKEMVSERMSLLNALAHASTDPELLRWLRNRLSEPFSTITKRLKDIEGENQKIHLQKKASVD